MSDFIGREGTSIRRLLDVHAATQVQNLSEDQVIEALQAQGINSLEDLVSQSLERARSGVLLGEGGEIAKDSFIYTQFIYKTEGPDLSEDLLEQVAGQLRR